MRRFKSQLVKFLFISFVIYLIYVFTKPIGLNEQFYRNDKFPNLNKLKYFRDDIEVF